MVMLLHLSLVALTLAAQENAFFPYMKGSHLKREQRDLPVETGCGGMIRKPDGILDYPGDGSDYPVGAKCNWRIKIKEGTRMKVTFERFSTSNRFDKVYIKEFGAKQFLGTYYGTTPPAPFETEGNDLQLMFRANKNSDPNQKGFRLMWKTIVVPDPVNQCVGTVEENSTLWHKLESTETVIMDSVEEGNANLTYAMDMKMNKLEEELQSMKDNQTKVLKDLAEANSKLDYIMKHIGSCANHDNPPTKPTTSPNPPTTQPISTTSTVPHVPPSLECTCGIPNYPNRIIGGQEIEPYKYPWHVGIYSFNHWEYFCGGTIINNLYVLTAAHCVMSHNPSNLMIGIGDHNQSSYTDNIYDLTQFLTVVKVYVHHLYDDIELDYDFALLKLPEAIKFNDGFGIRPICLPDSDTDTYENEIAVVLGWGATYFHEYYGAEDLSDTLQEIEVMILDSSCNYAYDNLTDSMMCAASPDKDACTGDSGGSLSISNNGQYTQVGVVSWGEGCALSGYPGVYARVASALDWVKRLSFDGEWCSASNSASHPPFPFPFPSPEPTPSSQFCSCGVPNYPHRIINGRPVEPQKYPWHVGLYAKSVGDKYFCGGSIINSLFVLTAAHCVHPKAPHDLHVGIGDHMQTITSDDESFTQTIKVAKSIRHYSYNDFSLDYDFALLMLSTHITFNNKFGIRPVCLPDAVKTYENEMGKILGWGENENQQYPITLHENDVAVYRQIRCKNAYSEQITNQMLCAASPGKDACSGDSGGSIAVMENGQYSVIGLTSWGHGCADPHKPGVYSRVTAALTWIKENAKEGYWCIEEE